MSDEDDALDIIPGVLYSWWSAAMELIALKSVFLLTDGLPVKK